MASYSVAARRCAALAVVLCGLQVQAIAKPPGLPIPPTVDCQTPAGAPFLFETSFEADLYAFDGIDFEDRIALAEIDREVAKQWNRDRPPSEDEPDRGDRSVNGHGDDICISPPEQEGTEEGLVRQLVRAIAEEAEIAGRALLNALPGANSQKASIEDGISFE